MRRRRTGRTAKKMAILWLCAALLLACLLVLIWALCAAAGAADAEYIEMDSARETTEAPEPTVLKQPYTIYPGVPLSDSYQKWLGELCRSYEVPTALVLAMMARESDFKADLVDDNGQSFGLMQIQPQWHRERMRKLGVQDLTDPAQNALVGVDFLAELIGRGYGIEWAVMAYNGGEVHAFGFYDRGEISSYCADVMKMYECFLESGMVVLNNGQA